MQQNSVLDTRVYETGYFFFNNLKRDLGNHHLRNRQIPQLREIVVAPDLPHPQEESNASNRLFCALPIGFFLPAVQADIKIFFIDLTSLPFLNSLSDTSVAWTFSANICGLVRSVLFTRYWVDNVNKFDAVT